MLVKNEQYHLSRLLVCNSLWRWPWMRLGTQWWRYLTSPYDWTGIDKVLTKLNDEIRYKFERHQTFLFWTFEKHTNAIFSIHFFRKCTYHFGWIFFHDSFLQTVNERLSVKATGRGEGPEVPKCLLAFRKDLIGLWKMLKTASKNIVPSLSYDFLKTVICL